MLVGVDADLEDRGRTLVRAVHCDLDGYCERGGAGAVEGRRIDREGVLENRALEAEEMRGAFTLLGTKHEV